MCDAQLEIETSSGGVETLLCVDRYDTDDERHGEAHRATVFWGLTR